MKKLVLLLILVGLLSGCLPNYISDDIKFNESFQVTYVIGDDVPDFEESFINTGNTQTEFLVDTGYLSMEAAGLYLVVITVFEEGNRDNELIIELQILINDSIL